VLPFFLFLGDTKKIGQEVLQFLPLDFALPPGQIRRFINIFVNGEDIRHKDGPKTAVSEGAEVSIIPAIAGG